MIDLYPYQEGAIARLRASIASGHRSPLLVSPVGSGKTVMFSYLTWKLTAARKRVLLLDHRDELTDQINEALGEFDIPRGVIVAGGKYYDPRMLAHVASVFTLARRLERVEVPDYIIVDEAHHCTEDSTWGRVIAFFRGLNPKLVVIGVTATPERLDGAGLGQVFDDIVLGPTVAELIAAGYLSPYKIFGASEHAQVDMAGVHRRGGDVVKGEARERVNKPHITGDAVMHYARYVPGQPAVAFCCDLKHCADVGERFQAEGWRFHVIDGKMDKGTRRNLVRDLGGGQIHGLVSCDLISEGFNIPAIVAAIQLRPTDSLVIDQQQKGRALRVVYGPGDRSTLPGRLAAIANGPKPYTYLFDHVGNCKSHGFPDDDREWSLDGSRDRKKKTDPDDIAIKQCPKCRGWLKSYADKCPQCGFASPVQQRRKIEERAGELEEIDVEAARIARRQAQATARTAEDLAKVVGEGAAAHILQARAEKAALRQRLLDLSWELQRLTGQDRMTRNEVFDLKPKGLREAIAQVEFAIEAAQAAAADDAMETVVDL